MPISYPGFGPRHSFFFIKRRTLPGQAGRRIWYVIRNTCEAVPLEAAAAVLLVADGAVLLIAHHAGHTFTPRISQISVKIFVKIMHNFHF